MAIAIAALTRAALRLERCMPGRCRSPQRPAAGSRTRRAARRFRAPFTPTSAVAGDVVRVDAWRWRSSLHRERPLTRRRSPERPRAAHRCEAAHAPRDKWPRRRRSTAADARRSASALTGAAACAVWARTASVAGADHRTSIESDAFLERTLDAAIAVADTAIRGSSGRCRASRYLTFIPHTLVARPAGSRCGPRRYSGLRPDCA
jgi:hypothetical protein